MGGRGRHFGAILGVWADSGSGDRLGKRLGLFVCDFKAKIAPTWGPRQPLVGAKLAPKSMPKSIFVLMLFE